MIKSWTIHFEMHRGYWPKLHIFRTPRHGDRVRDGGIPGTLVACPSCSGIGLLHIPDSAPEPSDLDKTLANVYSKLSPEERSAVEGYVDMFLGSQKKHGS